MNNLFSTDNFNHPGRVAFRGLNRLLRGFGFELNRASNGLSQEATLKRICDKKDFTLGTVVDVGSSDGRWSYKTLEYFPDSRYLLIDGNKVHQSQLAAFKQKFPNTDFVIAAAGEQVGTIWFDDSSPLGGLASDKPLSDSYVEVPVTTIDYEIAERSLPGPYCIKLDTHGYEVPILKGAGQTLANTELVIIETYNFKVAPDSLHFTEMIAFMGERGFKVIDMCEPIFRPADGSFWQIDLYFMRDSRPEFGYHGHD